MRKAATENQKDFSRIKILQKATEAVHSSLDLEEVFKKITDGFVHTLGYTTAFIVTMEDEKRSLKVRALTTKMRLLPQINKILGYSLENFSFPADPELSAGIRAVIEGRVLISDSLVDIAYPLVNKKTCMILQRLRQTKNYIVVPLMIEKQVVGGIFITSSEKQLPREELEMIKSFAHVASGAVKNANLHAQSMKMEKALQESESRYRELWDKAPAAYHILDKKGTIIRVNQTEADMLGYKKEEMVGKSIFSFILPSQRSEARKRFKKKISGCRVPREKNRIYVRKNGTQIYVAIDDVLDRDREGKVIGVRSTMIDTTKHRKAEEALRESEELFRSIVENSHAGILMVDDSYKIVYVNDQLCRILGYSRKETLGQDFRGFLDEESRKLVSDRYKKRQKGKKVPPRYEFNVVHKKGEKRHVEIRSAVIKDRAGRIHTVAQILDITERKRAEEELKQSEQDYRSVFENAHDAIIIFVPEDEIIIDVNPRACEMYGFSRSEFIGMSLEEISKDAATDKSRIKETLNRGRYHNFETVHYRKDGSEIFLEINAAVVNYKGKKAILSIHRDITERKKAEERLQIEKAHLAGLFESALEGIVMADTQGKVIRVNSEFTRLFGYMPEEVVGRHVDELIGTKEELDKSLLITRKVAQGENVAFEAIRRRKDGTAISVSVLASPIVLNGEVVAVYGIYRDITDRKRAEKALRVSEEKYRNLVELSPDAILFLDMKGVITSCNTFMTRATGYVKDEIIGKHLTQLKLLPKKDIPKYMNLLNSASRGETPPPFEVSWRHKDGTSYQAEVRIGFIKERGQDVGIQVVARDITERKKAEQKIKTSLQEKEVMLREIHHRVKNNMQIISSLLRLQSRKIGDKKILDIFNVSHNRIRSMALIHESLYQSKDLARINFSDYIKRLAMHLYSIYRPETDNIELEVDVRDIFLDINRAIPCGLIINELVSNSLKHAFPDGKRGKILVRMTEDKKGKYSLVIEDTGMGIPQDMDWQHTETLGMQLVTDLVKQLDGGIQLARGEGSKFEIVF
ncbi:MAG: PAS domain S-box protein [Candidatus Aminicenantes bacterium]